MNEIERAIMDYLDFPEYRKQNLSVLISQRLPYDYTYLSNLYSKYFNCTIERTLLLLRVEKAKELVVNGEALLVIAAKLGYSTVAHLSFQFREVTGITITEFRRQLKLKGKSFSSNGFSSRG
jgi:AraC-like DNA-binding protein